MNLTPQVIKQQPEPSCRCLNHLLDPPISKNKRSLAFRQSDKKTAVFAEPQKRPRIGGLNILVKWRVAHDSAMMTIDQYGGRTAQIHEQ